MLFAAVLHEYAYVKFNLRSSYSAYSLLFVVVLFFWSLLFHRLSFESWFYPIVYDFDAHYIFAYFKAVANGEAWPLWPKMVSSWGAPWGAHLSDFPVNEEWLWLLGGVLTVLGGPFFALNLIYFISYLTAAFAFYFVAKKMNLRSEWAFLFSLAFAFSPNLYWRVIKSHPQVSFLGFVPLGFYFLFVLFKWIEKGSDHLAVEKLNEQESFSWTFIIYCFFLGLYSPYYLNYFAQCLCLAIVLQLTFMGADKKSLRLCLRVFLIFLFIAGGAFVLGQSDSLLSNWLYGKSPNPFSRSMSDLELNVLNFKDLFVPSLYHANETLREWALLNRENSLSKGEIGSASLGLIGALALFFLPALFFIKNAYSKKRVIIIFLALVPILMIFYSIDGGINMWLGENFGLTVFRSARRSAVFIHAAALLGCGWLLSYINHSLLRGLLFILFAVVIVFDAGHWINREHYQKIKYEVDQDRLFIRRLEEQLPIGSALFLMPTMEFPEVPAIHELQDYEHFKLYYLSNKLENILWRSERTSAEHMATANRATV